MAATDPHGLVAAIFVSSTRFYRSHSAAANVSQSVISEEFYEKGRPGLFSLFWKILVLILLTALFATIAIGFYLRFALRDSYTDLVAEQLRGYVSLVAENIGDPPDAGHLDRLAQDYPIDIRVESQGTVWTTDTAIPPAAAVLRSTIRSRFDHGQTFLFREHGASYYGLLARGPYHYVVRFRSQPGGVSTLWATILLGGLLLLLGAGSYAAVKYLLRPVRDLMAGVRAVANANFKHRVPVRSADELGELTSAFNAMSEQIEAIIASKRRLLFDVSHELRSPLTRMNIAIAMLPDGKARTTLQRNANELNTMITELLENERLAVLGAPLVIEEVDLVAMVRSVVESFGDDAERIEYDSLTETLLLRADSQRLTIALRNVVSNALKYSDESEIVTVRVFPDDDGARVMVQDRGIGVPEDAQEMIFEPFYRTDESRTRATGGYGLGLALTRSIVEAHGGTIQLESKMGEGTTITFWIPPEPTEVSVRPPMTSFAA